MKLLAMALILLTLSPFPGAAAEVVGTLEVTAGEAQITRADGRTERVAAVSSLPYNVGVTTSKDGRAVFVLPGGVIRLGPETSLFAPTKNRIVFQRGSIDLRIGGGPTFIIEAGQVIMETTGGEAMITFRPPEGLSIAITGGRLDIRLPQVSP